MSILVSSNDGLEDYHEVAVQSGMKLVLAENVELQLKDSNTIAYYNPGGLKEDKRFGR